MWNTKTDRRLLETSWYHTWEHILTRRMRKATTQQQHDVNESNVDVHDARLELRGAKSLERD